MGKTHEALLRAEKEYKKNQRNPLQTVPKKVRALVEKQSPQISNRSGLEPYEKLKTSLLSRYPDGTIKTILFKGTKHGAGCSRIAVNFTTALAKDGKLRVLLVKLSTSSHNKVLNTDDDPGLFEITAESGHRESPIRKVRPSNLYMLTCIKGGLIGALGLFDPSEFGDFLKIMREGFDYIIVDAQRVTFLSEFRAVCSKVDGVVLVLNPGKTWRHIAIKAKKALEDAGGRVLGVVLSRRKY